MDGPSATADFVDWFSDDEDEISGESDIEGETEDLDTIRPTSCALGLSRDYVKTWTRIDAFREFYQNWKDAIVDSFELDPRDPAAFRPTWKETKDQIQITVQRQVQSSNAKTGQELLGFIRLRKKAGSLELVNFAARLEMRHLSLGGTDKWRNNKFAGIHGEGFKLAALVMRRIQHSVRISASSFYWNFNFGGAFKDRFYCRLRQAKPETIWKQREAFTKKAALGPRKELTSYVWKDVSVRIGKAKGPTGRLVTENDFRRWAAVSLDLSGPPPESIVRTQHGDLILDDAFSSQVYLKGLMVSSHAANGRRYVFGYNFAQGRINRDRERLTDPEEEATMIAKIWEEPILENREDVVRRYIELFHRDTDVPDIALSEKVVSEPVANAIWSYMRADLPDAFFYCEAADRSESDGIDQVTLIETTIKKEPVVIPKVLWKILRKFSLVRTTQEQRVHLFASSEPVQIPDMPFSRSVFRLLQAVLQLDSRLERIKIEVVRGGETGINLLYKEEQQRLLIHDKWLDFEQVHENAGCEASQLAKDKDLPAMEFFCDHVIEELFELVIYDLRKPFELDHSDALALRRHVRERIPQMPRGIEVFRADEAAALRVSWRGNECGVVADTYGADILYDVTLHKWRTCSQKREDLVQRIIPDGLTMPCDCPRQVVAREQSKAVFVSLDPNETYFPMVARRGSNVLFGIPPNPIRPQAPAASSITEPSAPAKARQSTGKARQRPPNRLPTSPDTSLDPPVPSSVLQDDDDLMSDDMFQLPPSSPSPMSEVVCASDPTDWLDDEVSWQSWYETELPRITARLFCIKTEACGFSDGSLNSSLDCQRLKCRFEQDSYVRFSLNDDNPAEYIALIHEIHGVDDGCDVNAPHFKATKYSFAKSQILLQSTEPQMTGNTDLGCWEELILHHRGTGSMCTRQDSEVILLDEIVEAQVLPDNFEIIHCARPPADPPSHTNMFCCLARRGHDMTVVFMPLARELLPRSDRRKLDGFLPNCITSVLDLTPNVLGTLGGFLEQGGQASAGLGYDEEYHQTWRVLNPRCRVFDGLPQDILHDFRSGKLDLPDLPAPGNPKVGLIAGENANFRLRPRNEKMPPIESFLAPLDVMDSVIKSIISLDFIVLVMPATILHESTIRRLAKSIQAISRLGYLVHVTLQPLRDYGIPQDRSTLVIIASPFPGLAGARIKPSRPRDANSRSSPAAVTVRDLIGNLAFDNPRATHGPCRGLVCPVPVGQDGGFGGSTKYIYNHHTGHDSTTKPAAIDMDSDTVWLSRSWAELVHPVRQDLFTVRELARLQGFDDEFIFYGSQQTQMRDVLAAHPPAMARAIAAAVQGVIKISTRKELSNTGLDPRISKRARAENGGTS